MLGPMRCGRGEGRSRVSCAVLDWMGVSDFCSASSPCRKPKSIVKEKPYPTREVILKRTMSKKHSEVQIVRFED